jgi:AcrR family transcriptional regulator
MSKRESGDEGREGKKGARDQEVPKRSAEVRARPKKATTREAIFAALESLLSRVPLQGISVADIIAEAGVSRATFYLYFSSRYDVLASLLDRVMDEIYATMRPLVMPDDRDQSVAEVRRTLEAGTALWAGHRNVLRAAHEHWQDTPELRARWRDVIERFTMALAAQIDRGRKAGVVPPGPPSRPLAAALLWGSDRCFYVGGLGADADVPAEQELVEPLTALWIGAIFGADAPAPAPARGGGSRR